ncbi:MAG: gspG1 [Verrucomicrobiaceae bacterium]|nr:gspG1 [Verrucomicrobiaceae bacterium]
MLRAYVGVHGADGGIRRFFVFERLRISKERERNWAQEGIVLVKTNLGRYREREGFVPSIGQGLGALAKRPAGKPVPQQWQQLIDPSALSDSWGHPFQYRLPDKGASDFEVYSMGPDGQDGTEDDIYEP